MLNNFNLFYFLNSYKPSNQFYINIYFFQKPIIFILKNIKKIIFLINNQNRLKINKIKIFNFSLSLSNLISKTFIFLFIYLLVENLLIFLLIC